MKGWLRFMVSMYLEYLKGFRFTRLGWVSVRGIYYKRETRITGGRSRT